MARLQTMKTNLSIACAASLFLLSFALPGDQVRFAVKEKTKLSKVFTEKSELHSTKVSASFDGKTEEADGVTLTLEDSSHVEITDEYGPLKDGKPAKLTRTYDKLSGTSVQKVDLPDGAGSAPDTEKERSSELEGKTVVFKLNEDGDGYRADFPEGKGDADLLKRLEEDMDLRGFLPSGEVAVDKSWEIDAKVFNSVLGTPGGDLKIKAKDDEDESQEIDQQLEDNLKGKGKGTYKGKREVDGHKCAVIALAAELETTGKEDQSAKDPHRGKTDVELEFVVEGELLWDVEEGHFRTCKLSSKVKMKWNQTMSMTEEEEKHELVQMYEFEGEAEFTAEIGG